MKHSLYYISILILIAAPGCKKYVEVPLPNSSIVAASVFQNDYTTAGALNSIYAAMYNQNDFDGQNSVGYLTGLYGDELKNVSVLPSYQAVYTNSVSSTIGGVTVFWSSMYSQLYSVNLAIEGLTASNNLNYHDTWLGEAYFLRGLLYFYLTNLYGDVPLVLGSDYLHNNGLSRSSQSDVYNQIVSDLKQAQSLLPVQYHDMNGLVTTKDRSRPNRAAASALLARVYLYMQDWKDAAAQANNVIADASYQLVKPSQTFLVNSNEIIWGIVPIQTNLYPYIVKDVKYYFLPQGKTPVASGILVTLSDSLVNAFEPNDARYTNWAGIDSVSPTQVYYFAYKYKANGTYTTAQESVVMLRLAEQYLIRAEARAQQNDLTGALSDLNTIRTRAGLPASTATTQTAVLNAIQKERRVELFTETGHRFFDLRRTGALDALMTKLSPLKGGVWASYKSWWPIPLSDAENDPNLIQTSGYQ